MAGEREPDPNDDSDLLPVKRDWGFLVKLIVALVAGGIVATLLGIKLRQGAAGCGTNLVRPGGTVIPPESQQTPAPSPRR